MLLNDLAPAGCAYFPEVLRLNVEQRQLRFSAESLTIENGSKDTGAVHVAMIAQLSLSSPVELNRSRALPPPDSRIGRQVHTVELLQHSGDHRTICTIDHYDVPERGDRPGQSRTIVGDLAVEKEYISAPNDNSMCVCTGSNMRIVWQFPDRQEA
ncbi:MAG TPA: hypothetical protein VGU24_06735 [Microvirga sp.]|jgi:hypothetical protein|nr:hypothetical protein [Microvirga sp.]